MNRTNHPLIRKARTALRLVSGGEFREAAGRATRTISRLSKAGERRRAAERLRALVAAGPPFAFSIADLSKTTEAPVFLAEAEARALSDYASRSHHVVEIGAAYGGSSSLLLASLPKGGRLWSIDPFVIDSMSIWHASAEECRRSVTRLLRVLGREALLTHWTLLTEPSYEAVKGWKEPIEMIFIDGDHSYEAVKQDFEDWYPHVTKGGHLLIHDSRRRPGTPKDEFGRGWPGPTKLARELARDRRVSLVDTAESLTIWEKR